MVVRDQGHGDANRYGEIEPEGKGKPDDPEAANHARHGRSVGCGYGRGKFGDRPERRRQIRGSFTAFRMTGKESYV
jgi:hypothetical protein